MPVRSCWVSSQLGCSCDIACQAQVGHFLWQEPDLSFPIVDIAHSETSSNGYSIASGSWVICPEHGHDKRDALRTKAGHKQIHEWQRAGQVAHSCRTSTNTLKYKYAKEEPVIRLPIVFLLKLEHYSYNSITFCRSFSQNTHDIHVISIGR